MVLVANNQYLLHYTVCALRVLIRNTGFNQLVLLLVSSSVWIPLEIPRPLASSATPEIPLLLWKCFFEKVRCQEII